MSPPGGQNYDYKKLAIENESLKTDLAKLNALKKVISPLSGNLLEAFVYSEYPFNFKSRILTDKGTKDGVKVGQPVLISSSSSAAILAGKINEVFDDYSLVETIFDSGFQISVRIGGAGANSLLVGGNSPKLTLIPKDAKITDGDAVYSSSPDYPFGLAIGLARNIRLSADQFFEEADLETAYNPNDFQTVFIDINSNVKGEIR